MHEFFKMSDTFIFQLPRRIIFGNGAVKNLGQEAKTFLQGKRILLVTDPGVIQAGLGDEATASLKDQGFEIVVFDECLPDCPLEVAKKGMEVARREKVEVIFGLGGGSSLDTAKAIALMQNLPGDLRQYLGINKIMQPGLPMILTPTTAGTGSEISSAFVVADEQSGDKVACYSPYAFADIALTDPLLTMSMPPRLTAESGIDAFAHALESFVTLRANPLSDTLALRALEIIARHLPKAFSKGSHDLESRYAMCMGATLATMAIRSSGLGIVHGTSNPVAMNCHVSHGVAISLMMPAVMEFNLPAQTEKYAAVARAMGEKVDHLSAWQGAGLAVEAVRRLLGTLGLPTRLRDVGAKQEDLARFAQVVGKRSQTLLEVNPRNAEEKDLMAIYQSAW